MTPLVEKMPKALDKGHLNYFFATHYIPGHAEIWVRLPSGEQVRIVDVTLVQNTVLLETQPRTEKNR